MTDDPLFIIGTERSGSNLLRLVLNAHSRVDIPHPPHILRYFAPLEPGYGDLSDDAAFARLVDDVLALLDTHIHPWEHPIDRARVLAEARPRDAFGVMVALYEQHREWAGKPRWGCKSTFMIAHVDRVLARYPRAGLIWLVRDPRDVAASSQSSVFNPFHPLLTAELWREQQRQGLALQQRLGDRVCRLRYEDLLAEPEATVRALCAHLEEDFEPGMLRFNETDAARRIAGLSESWRNAGSPILQGNTGTWRQRLSEEQVREVEAVAGDLMEGFGYTPEHPDAVGWSPGLLRRARVEAEARAQQVRVELRSIRKDRNHFKRWRRAVLMAGIQRRARR